MKRKTGRREGSMWKSSVRTHSHVHTLTHTAIVNCFTETTDLMMWCQTHDAGKKKVKEEKVKRNQERKTSFSLYFAESVCVWIRESSPVQIHLSGVRLFESVCVLCVLLTTLTSIRVFHLHTSVTQKFSLSLFGESWKTSRSTQCYMLALPGDLQ